MGKRSGIWIRQQGVTGKNVSRGSFTVRVDLTSPESPYSKLWTGNGRKCAKIEGFFDAKGPQGGLIRVSRVDFAGGDAQDLNEAP